MTGRHPSRPDSSPQGLTAGGETAGEVRHCCVDVDLNLPASGSNSTAEKKYNNFISRESIQAKQVPTTKYINYIT